MAIGKDTVEAIADRIKVVLISQIPGLNEAYKNADDDLSISIGTKIGSSPDGGNSYEVNISYVKDKVKIGSRGSVSEGQEDLFAGNGKQERPATEGLNGGATHLQKDVADSLRKIAEAAQRGGEGHGAVMGETSQAAIAPAPAAIGPGESVIDVEVVGAADEGLPDNCNLCPHTTNTNEIGKILCTKYDVAMSAKTVTPPLEQCMTDRWKSEQSSSIFGQIDNNTNLQEEAQMQEVQGSRVLFLCIGCAKGHAPKESTSYLPAGPGTCAHCQKDVDERIVVPDEELPL